MLVLAIVTATGCDTGASRSTRGRDAGRHGFDALVGRGPGGPTDDESCASVSLVVRRVIPEVTVVVDQSGSMEEPLSDGLSRWQAVHRVLTGPDGLVTTTESIVRYGLALYSDVAG